MASNAGNIWEKIEGLGLFLYFHGIIFVVNYKMNIISSHKMYKISPSVTCAAVRGWFWVSGCSSDMSGCIHWYWYWYPGDCLRSSATSEAMLPWPSVAELRLRPRITGFWGSFWKTSCLQLQIFIRQLINHHVPLQLGQLRLNPPGLGSKCGKRVERLSDF